MNFNKFIDGIMNSKDMITNQKRDLNETKKSDVKSKDNQNNMLNNHNNIKEITGKYYYSFKDDPYCYSYTSSDKYTEGY